MMPDAVDQAKLDRGRDVVVYDSDPGEVTGTAVAVRLIRQGFKVSVLKGGVADWAGANFPAETKSAPKATPPPAKA